ncbi:NAD(P)-binding protein [Melanomma pulvis-pyrius CBS 109.77]|uniref:NAD(P)-binding protein n=1 Tax=Melanomma pulvis-pyrius CBS 109.77 TaxID=1314802 RepID=A0A6A6WTP6_9PLEO|nr:NAD(P)-binding protein [Melanomma pulvis-pyrius CBS 109.77]
MSNPVALITGGASGIGLALTKHLLDQGWKVVIADINEEAGKALEKELGSSSSFVRADVTIYSDQIAMFKHAFSWGENRLDFFAANAGVDDRQDMHMSAEDLDENGDPKPLNLTTVDLTAVIQGCWIYKHYARKNIKRGGKIVITSSVAGLYASPINPQYSTAKAACVHLARCIGPPFLKNENIIVNVICPAFIMTALCPPKIRELFPKDQITPMETCLNAYDKFLQHGTLTGQVAELSIEKVIFHKQVGYANENQRWMLEDALKVWQQAYGDPLQ